MKKLLVLLVLCVLCLTGCWTVSEGDRVGTLTKLSKKGLFIKTWEGEMILGGTGASGNDSNVFVFSVDNEALIPALQDAQKSAGVITLQYHEEFTSAFWRGDTNYYIDGVIK